MAERIGKYTVERTLGQGGFGKVYLASDPDVGQSVAIKRLIAQGDPDLLKRFQMEIRTTASLRHKNIVTIFASGEEAGDPYLVMEFLEGQTLKQIIQQNRPLSLLDKVRIMTQVAEGLAYAHSKGVVHRDVKPENIMLLPDDTVKIMDFGISVGPNRSVTVTQTGGIIGTPPYFAPEQLQGLKANEQTDIFSFGDVYYELLSGVHPFEDYKGDWRALQVAIISHEPRSIGELVPGCPEALETLVHRALAKDVEFRYQRFEEIQLDSEAILVDLKHEGAAAILRQVNSLSESGDLRTAFSKINQAYQLDPGNREVRRLREEINVRLQKTQSDKRVAQLLSTAEQQLIEGRYPEAVQTFESASKLDSGNAEVTGRLEDARRKLEGYLQTNRLVAEARFQQQKGLLAEAGDRLQRALEIDPHHTEALRLSQRVQAELERRRAEERRRETIRAVEEQIAAKQFQQASEILDAAEAEQPDPAFANLRAETQRQQAEEARRKRAERFNMAIARTRETIDAEDFSRAGQMLQHLETNFSSHEGARAILLDLRERLENSVAAKEIAGYGERARVLLSEGSLREALDVLQEARAKYSTDAGLQKLERSAEERYRAHLRSEAIASAIREANEKRNAGDPRGALESIAAARRESGEDAALANLAWELEAEIERNRYRAELDDLLKSARTSISAGRYAEAIDRLGRPGEFASEREVLALLEDARDATALEEQRRFVDQTLRKAARSEAEHALGAAAAAVEEGLARFPNEQGLSRAAERLRGLVDLERRRASIRTYISRREWEQAAAALGEARDAFPTENFGGLAVEIETGGYEDGWRELQARVQRQIESDSLSQAVQELDAQATRKVYAGDPRWQTLLQEVGRRKDYEDALQQADRKRAASHFSEAEALLTEIIAQGPPDDRAAQMRRAIQAQRSETARQSAAARITTEIREDLNRGDLASGEERLAAARTRYPGESAWDELQSECDALRHRTEIEAAVNDLRRLVAEDKLPEAGALLRGARARYPGEEVWAVLDAELDLRGASKDNPNAEAVRRLAAQLQQLREKEPASPLWPRLERDIAEFEELRGERETAVAGEEIRRLLQTFDIAGASENLRAARARWPEHSNWEVLERETQARQNERDDIRRHLTAILDKGQAGEAVDLIQGRYANAPAFSDLMERAHQELEAQRLREARQSALTRLLAVEREIAAEKSKRGRHNLGAEAQRIAAGYPNDEEMGVVAERIRVLLKTPQVTPGARKPIRWIAAGIAAAAALAVLLAVVFHRNPPHLPHLPRRPVTVAFEIRTDPPGAQVHVGDRSCQTPNCTFDLLPGSYPVDAQLNGYVEQQRTISVDASSNAIELLLAPVPPRQPENSPPAYLQGTLEVRADVPDALVYVDGIPRSRTDASGSVVLKLEAARHSVQVTRNGYDSPAPLEIRIIAGGRQTMPFRLTVRAATLELDGAPAGATVSIGGAALGRTDGSVAFVFPAPIAPGEQTLEVALGTASRSVKERFEPGLINRLRWADVAPAAQPHSKASTEGELRDWERVRTSTDIPQLRAFLQNHPSGAHAPAAEGLIADLTWAAVDQTNADTLRQFVRDNPMNPHRAEAQKLIDQLDARAAEEAAKRQSANRELLAKKELAKQQDATKAAQETAARQQIMAVLDNLNSAIQHRRATDIRTIWKDVSPDFLEAVQSADPNISFTAAAPDIRFSGGNEARVSCQMRSGGDPKKFTFTFQYDGTAWTIASGHVN
jgi:serine/threonine protein kinase